MCPFSEEAGTGGGDGDVIVTRYSSSKGVAKGSTGLTGGSVAPMRGYLLEPYWSDSRGGLGGKGRSNPWCNGTGNWASS